MDDAQKIWFPGANATSNAEHQFVVAIRSRAAAWAELGLSHARSAGVPVVRPLLCVEVPNTSASLRWLWILFVETKRELAIECSWGDDTRLNDWGPTAGDVTITIPRSTGTPEERAEYASHWVTTQATRGRPCKLNQSDPIDAEAAARSVIREDLDELAQPRRSRDRTALRVLLAARALVDQQRTANRNALTALVRSIDLSVDARKPLTDAQIATIAPWRTSRDDAVNRVFREEARRLARAVLEQTEMLRENHRQLAQLTEALAPGLQSIPGVGAVTGAILVAAYSHHGRVRSEAAFAALGGIAPLPASSGTTTRHRLSRSGDRQLNRAVDVVVRTRLSYDPVTREYASRRRAEGLSNREIRRCLKRYVCRALYRELRTRMT